MNKLYFDSSAINKDIELWRKRYNNFVLKMKEQEEKLLTSLHVSTQMPVDSKNVVIWLYTIPVKLSQDIKKNIGNWIRELLGIEGKPYHTKQITDYEKVVSWFNEFEDEDGKYIVTIKLVFVSPKNGN